MAPRCYIVPPNLLQHAAQHGNDERLCANAKQTLERDAAFRSKRQGITATATLPPAEPPSALRLIHDAKNSPDEDKLPGQLIRKEENSNSGDPAVDNAFVNIGKVLDFYKEQCNWNSFDNKNRNVVCTVHFGVEYENAFWDPEKEQLVFGDGDDFLTNFAGCIDVVAHELTHAVIDNSSPLHYWGMSGALNEHIADVFGIMVKQKAENKTAAEADWLIGEECILPEVKGMALRNMKEPGTAYDDPSFGKDPQVAHMKDFQVTSQDLGGVHIYSGIPNRAFCLASIAFGGYSWEKAGRIWWTVLSSKRISPNCTFKEFANATLDVATEIFDKEANATVRQAWRKVGVLNSLSRPKVPNDRCTYL